MKKRAAIVCDLVRIVCVDSEAYILYGSYEYRITFGALSLTLQRTYPAFTGIH